MIFKAITNLIIKHLNFQHFKPGEMYFLLGNVSKEFKFISKSSDSA